MLDTAIGRMFPPAFSEARADVIAERKGSFAKVDAECFARACLGSRPSISPRSWNIKNRALVMCGALDQTTPPASRANARGENSRRALRGDPGWGHCPMLEQPGALVEKMSRFL